MLQTGDILVGRYEIVSLLGRGGMSSVYAAVDLTLDREVAVKVLAGELAHDGVFVERFEREARAAASLSHRNVVSVFDSGVDDGSRFIVMERVSGRTLSRLIRNGPLPVARSVEIAVNVARALAAAHVRGIVHRDVKPGNVMVAEGGQVKVLDFGIARALAATSLTRTATVIGTAGYLSPEQARGGAVDGRSDVYGLGCVLYEMLTGTPPFIADSAAALAHQHIARRPDAPSRLRPEVSPALDAIVLRCLEKDPDARYESAEALGLELVAAPLDGGSRAPDRGAAATRMRALTGGVAPTRGGLTRGPLRAMPGGRRFAAGLALVAVLLAATALALALGGGSAGRPPGESARASVAGAQGANRAPATRAARGPTATQRAGTDQAARPSTQAAPPQPSDPVAALSALLLADQRQGLLDAKASRALTRGVAALLAARYTEDPGVPATLAELERKIDQLAGKGAIATPGTAAALKAAAANAANAPSSASPPAEAPRERGEGHGHGRHHGGGEGSQD